MKILGPLTLFFSLCLLGACELVKGLNPSENVKSTAKANISSTARYQIKLTNGQSLTSFDIRIQQEELHLIYVYQKPRILPMNEVAGIFSLTKP